MKQQSAVVVVLLVVTINWALGIGAQSSTAPRPNQIKYEYVAPKDAVHQPIHDQMKKVRALESLQELLGPLRLNYTLTIKLEGCDGRISAWYDDEVVTVCYEMLDQILKGAPAKDLPGGLSRADAILGPALAIFLHEAGHAVFNMLQIPVLGREEDAADQFAAYLMLRLSKGEARKLVLGAAYHHAIQMPGPNVTLPIEEFSGEHSTAAQRAYNLLCIAYGADPRLFADLVEKDFLPKDRAEVCAREYDDVDFAMTKLIKPHIDMGLAQNSHEVWARTVGERRARPAKR